MRIHAICLVKNEADIIEFTLRRALEWCHAIYVLDNGSNDGTWKLVNTLAAAHPAIVPFQSTVEPFDDGLRSRVFNRFQSQAKEGDWWCRLDADEIYIDDPSRFLASVSMAYQVVWAIQLQYYLVHEELGRFAGVADYSRIESWDQLPRHYRSDASEARFFRHRSRLRWPSGAWPRHMGLACPRRILMKHYKYRSPRQLKERLSVRQGAARVSSAFQSALTRTWDDQFGHDSELHFDDGSGNYIIEEAMLPSHMESASRRVLKRFLHGTGIWP